MAVARVLLVAPRERRARRRAELREQGLREHQRRPLVGCMEAVLKICC
jgi:hypothetical protein